MSREAERLHNDGVDIIIGLGHSGYEKDKDVALNVPHVDVVVGAHSHSFLFTPTKQFPNPSNNEIEEVRASKIELSTKVLDSSDRLRDTLIHEMCHAAAWVIR